MLRRHWSEWPTGQARERVRADLQLSYRPAPRSPFARQQAPAHRRPDRSTVSLARKPARQHGWLATVAIHEGWRLMTGCGDLPMGAMRAGSLGVRLGSKLLRRPG